MDIDFLTGPVISGVVGCISGYLGARFKMRYKYAPLLKFSDTEHMHAFDTMLADGKGWRCGECGMRREV